MSRNENRTPLREQKDEELIRVTLSGDSRGFDELVKRHARRLHSTLFQMLGSEADAYDIAQEAFLKAYKSLKDFNGESAFYTWLYAIALNKARNFLRKRGRQGFVINIDEGDDDAAIPMDKRPELIDHSPVADPLRQVQVGDLRHRLKDALAKLSPNHQEIIMLCDIQGLSYPEIALSLGISEGTLRSRRHYAIQELRGLLADMYQN